VVESGDWRWKVSYWLWVYPVTPKITDVIGERQLEGGQGWDVHRDLRTARWVYRLTKYISDSESIRADSAWMDCSKAVHASSVKVPTNWGLVQVRSKNFLDWIGLDLDGPGPDWIIAGLVESLESSQSYRRSYAMRPIRALLWTQWKWMAGTNWITARNGFRPEMDCGPGSIAAGKG